MNAHNVDQYLQSAAGEIGYGAVAAIEFGYAEPEVKKALDAFVKSGGEAEYFGEVYADQIYNNVDFQVDMIGDQIFGEPNRAEILDGLERQYPKAVAILRKR